MPGLGSQQVCRSSEGDSFGEVVVIVAGDEPRKACLKAPHPLKHLKCALD